MKRILCIICVLMTFGDFSSFAQNDYSFFYFEGNLGTPIYVKVEGQMQPRYGQNHFIIPNLAAGYTHFEILFQQNKFPPQKFFLEVPKDGFRGFQLRKIDDKKFALYDLQQKTYIFSGNSKKEGAAPQYNFKQLNKIIVPKVITTEKEKTTFDKLPKFKVEKNNQQLPQRQAITDNPEDFTNDSFINGVVLNDGDKNDVFMKPKQMSNTDCPMAMSNVDFENFALKLLKKEGDDNRLQFLKKQAPRHCFSTEQVRIIARSLKTQSARFEAVKTLYSRTTDQKKYSELEQLFNTLFLKEKFKSIIN